jgi:hypothetical protein
MPTRAKFVLQEEKRNAYQPGTRYLKFAAQYDPDCPEDQRFSKYTPSGTLEMTVDNPNAQFELGTAYYLDFTPAVTEAAEAAPAAAQE